MAEGGKEPEESTYFTFIWDEDGQEPSDTERDGEHYSIPASFSFQEGEELRSRVQQLEKELENVRTIVNGLCTKNKDDTNQETKLRRQEESRIGQLIAEIDSMKKELHLKEEDRQHLRDELDRVVRSAQEERAKLMSYYEREIVRLKQRYEGRGNVSESRLLKQLDSEVKSLEKSIDNKNPREVLFTVRQVPNNDSLQPLQHYLICFSCKDPYHPSDLEETCLFHPLPPMKRSKWEKDWVLDLDPKKYQNYCYWACCNTLARKRPPGCCRGRHHQKWECDILLKKAMQVDQVNTKKMLERSSSKVKIITD